MASWEPSTSAVPADSSINIEVQEAELAEVKDIMNDVYKKLSHQDTDLNTFLKGKIKDLESSKTELVGVFGRTGAGKSTLINAIIGETNLLPCGGSGGTACTSVMIQVQANMKDSKYIAEIEFIPAKEWADELQDLKMISRKHGDSDDSDDDDSDDDNVDDKKTDGDDINEKFSALYGEDFKEHADIEDYLTDKKFRDIGIPEFLKSQKILKCENSSDLSKEIAPYTRRDSKRGIGRQYWPLVKCVTIKVPKARKILQHVAIVDLPGTGDRNKSRDEMWKKFVQNCAAVWIVSDKCRASSEKEPWEILNQTISLIGNGGECQSICFICTKSDVLGITDGNLSERDCVLQSNEEVKEQLREEFKKEKNRSSIKKHFGEESDLFKVFTVSSKTVKYLQEEDTEIPELRQFLEYLSDRHSKTKTFVKGAYGILSLMKGNTQGTDSKADVDLKTSLQKWINTVNQSMTRRHNAFEKCLDEGVSKSVKKCDKVLACATGKKGCGHHSKLKSLVQNNGIYKPKSKKGSNINLNERLCKYMREEIDSEFCKTFPNERQAGPIKEAINTFPLVTKSLRDKHKEVALQMTFLKTEEEKLKTKLVNVIREEKKYIYSSLEVSIQKSMQPCYKKAEEHHGTGMKNKIKQELKDHLNASKSIHPSMFEKAKRDMLERMEFLKDTLLDTLRNDMQTSIDQSLKNNFKSVPDVTEQYEKVKICHDKLNGTAGGRENETPGYSRKAQKRSRPRTAGHQPCGKNCIYCPQSADLEEFTNPHTKTIVRLETLTTCETTNVIYAIQCPCSKLYIGKTSTALKDRINKHKCDIRGKVGSLGKHFAKHGHSENDLTFWAIEKVQGGDLGHAEARWINELNTRSSSGLNENKA